jgi:hypothetical protein
LRDGESDEQGIMNRRNAALALLLGPIAFGVRPLAANGQQPGKVYRLGYLSQPTRESVEPGSRHSCAR